MIQLLTDKFNTMKKDACSSFIWAIYGYSVKQLKGNDLTSGYLSENTRGEVVWLML